MVSYYTKNRLLKQKHFPQGIYILSNVRLTLPRGIPPVDTVDVAKNNNFLSQCGKIYFCRIPKACLSSPFPLSHPESLTPILSVRLSHSHSLTPTLTLFTLVLFTLVLFTLALFTLALSFTGGISRSLFVHCLDLSICLRLCALHLYALKVSGLFVFALFVSAKGWFFYFVYVGKVCKDCSFKWFSCIRMFFLFVCGMSCVWSLDFYAIFDGKSCKGCSFKWFFILKDVFFLFVVWFHIKFGFLCSF